MQQVLSQKNVQEAKFEAAVMILGPWNQTLVRELFHPTLTGKERPWNNWNMVELRYVTPD